MAKETRAQVAYMDRKSDTPSDAASDCWWRRWGSGILQILVLVALVLDAAFLPYVLQSNAIAYSGMSGVTEITIFFGFLMIGTSLLLISLARRFGKKPVWIQQYFYGFVFASVVQDIALIVMLNT